MAYRYASHTLRTFTKPGGGIRSPTRFRRLILHSNAMIAHGCPNSECAIVNPLLLGAFVRSLCMRRAVRWAFGQQRPSIIARRLCSFLPLCFPLSLSLPLPRQTSLYETVHPILFPVSDRPFVVRTSLSADDEMASKKRKGERARRDCESHTVRSLSRRHLFSTATTDTGPVENKCHALIFYRCGRPVER